MIITRKSIISGIERTKDIDITQEELDRIANGEYIQNVVPHISPSNREFIMTGITDEEWEDTLPDA